jgi:hypothetical protein
MEHNVMDNNELLKLSLSKGGIGNATFDYKESPSTQTYTQNASQQLNAGYNQMLADIHRMGDVDTAKFNMDLKALNAGLENKYKEELKEKEFNNELKKLRFTHDLTMQKYEKARQDQLADRDWLINFQKQEEEKNYRRNLPYFMDTNEDSPIKRQHILQDPKTGEYSYYKSDTLPTIELPDELRNEYYEFNKLKGRNYIGDFHPIDVDEFKNYLTNKYNTIDDRQKLTAYHNFLDNTYPNYLNNLPNRHYYEFHHRKGSPDDPLVDYRVHNENLLGNNINGGPLDHLMAGMTEPDKTAAQNFIIQNNLKIASTKSQESVDASEIAKIINATSPQKLNEFYGFVNNHGMDDKIILVDPDKPRNYYLYEKNSNNLYALYLSHYTRDGKPYFEPLGPVGFESLDRSKNNYEDKGLLKELTSSFNNSMYNFGKNINEFVTNGGRAKPNPNNDYVIYKGKKYGKEYLNRLYRDYIKTKNFNEKHKELLDLFEKLNKPE